MKFFYFVLLTHLNLISYGGQTPVACEKFFHQGSKSIENFVREHVLREMENDETFRHQKMKKIKIKKTSSNAYKAQVYILYTSEFFSSSNDADLLKGKFEFIIEIFPSKKFEIKEKSFTELSDLDWIDEIEAN